MPALKDGTLGDLTVPAEAFEDPKVAMLLHGRCFIPSLDTEAKRINHAYSLISQAYEPLRISHTGNVFSKVFYKDGPVWKPLEALRGYECLTNQQRQ